MTASGGRVVQRSRTLSSWTVTRLREVVVARVSLAPGDASLRVGERLPFLVTAYDSGQNTVSDAGFAWSSSKPGVVSVDQAGIATGVSPGSRSSVSARIRHRCPDRPRCRGRWRPLWPLRPRPTAAPPPRRRAQPAALEPCAAHALGLAPGGIQPRRLRRTRLRRRNARRCTDLGVWTPREGGSRRTWRGPATFYGAPATAGRLRPRQSRRHVQQRHGRPPGYRSGPARYQRGCDGGNAVSCRQPGLHARARHGGPVDLGQARAPTSAPVTPGTWSPAAISGCSMPSPGAWPRTTCGRVPCTSAPATGEQRGLHEPGSAVRARVGRGPGRWAGTLVLPTGLQRRGQRRLRRSPEGGRAQVVR